MGFRKGSHDEILFQERPRLDYHLSPTGLVSMMVGKFIYNISK
jgi:hypothetical protein